VTHLYEDMGDKKSGGEGGIVSVVAEEEVTVGCSQFQIGMFFPQQQRPSTHL
jgi:hypothetical protein